MTKATFIFDGTMHALQPLTVTIKGASSIAGHRLPRNGGPDSPVYWPATTIRGTIRHMAHRAAVIAVREANNGAIPLDLADHFLLAQGTDIEGSMPMPGVDEIDALEKLGLDPLLSLFGYWGGASKACIGNAFPTTAGCSAMFGGGARTIMFERNPSLLELLNQTQKDRLSVILTEQSEASIDIQEFKAKKKELTKRLKTANKEDKEALYSQMNEIDAAITARKEQKTEAKESIRRPIDQYEAITAGTEMSHRMDLKGIGEIELGFFLHTLLAFAREPYMGGHKNHNCGLVKASWTVKTWPEEAIAPIEVGTVGFGPDGFDIQGETLQRAFDTWVSQRAKLTFGKVTK